MSRFIRLLLSFSFFLSILIVIFLSANNRTLDLFGTTPATIFTPSAHAASACAGAGGGCVRSGADCNSHGCAPNIGISCNGDPSGLPVCCICSAPPPPPPCDIITCGPWGWPPNTCYTNNESRACAYTQYSGGGTCTPSSAPTEYQTGDECFGGNDPDYICVAQVCVPFWSLTGTVTDPLNGGGVGGIGVSAGGFGTGTGGGGGYSFIHDFRTGCYTVSIALPGDYIAYRGPASKGFCVGGDQVRNFTITRVYDIKGRVVDPLVGNRGIPGIRVSVAGHTTTTDGNGNYDFPDADHIIRGSYTVTAAVPTCWFGMVTSRGVTVGGAEAGVTVPDLTMTKQYTIAGTVSDPKNGNRGVPNVSVHVIGKTTTTDGNGNYFFGCPFNIHVGTHTVSITIPTYYTNTTVTSRNATVGPAWTNNATGIDFGITKLFTIDGNIFVDKDINKLKQGGEANYPARPSISFTNTSLAISRDQEYITTRADGSYTIYNAITSNITVSYTSLPPGYYMTTPLNGPPPAYRVHIGFNCNTNGAPGASCVAAPGPNGGQDIQNLNFGIINDKPWIQAVCGDIRDDNGFSNPEAAGQEAITTNGTCANPGIVFTGDTNANFGRGTASSTGRVVGGTAYPEVFNSTGNAQILTSYNYLLEKANSANIPIRSLPCNLGSCNLPGNLAHGVYKANGPVTLNAYNFPTGQNYVILIKGKLTFNGDIKIPNTSSAIFAMTGDIIVPATVGTNPATGSPNPNIEGIYSTQGSFIVQSANNCGVYTSDLRLNIGGAIFVNAAENGGGITDNRNLCRFNALYPMLQITQRPDLLLNVPEFMRNQQSYQSEVAP